MISRYSIVCPGCAGPFLVRLGVTPSKMTRFYVPCPLCGLPVRGRSYGEELYTHRVEFEADSYNGGGEAASVVTIDPNVPSRYSAADMTSGLGSAPNMTLLWLAGDRASDLFNCLSLGRQAAEEGWPQVRRLFEYYLADDWERFNIVGRATFEDQWQDPGTTHERATHAYQALGFVLSSMVDDNWPASTLFLDSWLRNHSAALQYAGYIGFARAEAGASTLSTLQRRIFDVLDLFVRQIESWQIGVLGRIIPPENLPLLRDLRLFRDEFDILRDLYQQSFETICKTLRYPVAAHNIVTRGDVDDFGSIVPSALTRKVNPSSLAAFEKLSNFEKLQYVAHIPGCEGWTALLDNKTRNAIGHASVRHDLRTGLVVSDHVPGGVPYLDVVADVYGIFDALRTPTQVLRGIRILSSPDFGSAVPR